MAIPFYNQADQDIYAGGDHFIPQEDYRLNYTPSTTLASTVGNSGGVTGTQAAYPYYPQGGGGSFDARQLVPDFYSATANRQKALENPNWLGKQINKFIPQQRSVKDMVTPPTGNYSRSIAHTKNFGLDVLPGQGQYGEMPGVIEGDERRTGGLPLGIGSMIAKMMPDKYYDMDTANQAYIQSQMGYSGPTIFGENTMGNKDPFGRNVRSAFGDYGAAQQKSVDKMDERIKSENFIGKYGNLSLEQDEDGNWSFVGGPGAAEANRMNKLNLQRYNFDKRGLRKLDLIKRNVSTQKKMRDAWEAETGREMDQADINFADTGDYDEYSGAGGTPSYNIPASTYTYEGSDEQDKANEGASNTGGSTGGSTSGGSYSRPGSEGAPGHHWAKGGRVGYRTAGPVFGHDEPSEPILDFMQDQNIPFSEQVEGGPTEEQIAMVMDMDGKGIDMETISSITGLGKEIVLNILGVEMAQGGIARLL